jgi:hypothetical protein
MERCSCGMRDAGVTGGSIFYARFAALRPCKPNPGIPPQHAKTARAGDPG